VDKGTIRLLIADVVMPGASGAALADRVGEIRPDIPVLYVSGYAEGELRREGVNPADQDLLVKPFTHKSLVEAVRRMLDKGVSE